MPLVSLDNGLSWKGWVIPFSLRLLRKKHTQKVRILTRSNYQEKHRKDHISFSFFLRNFFYKTSQRSCTHTNIQPWLFRFFFPYVCPSVIGNGFSRMMVFNSINIQCKGRRSWDPPFFYSVRLSKGTLLHATETDRCLIS